jgi:hypothetical protein
MNLKCHMNCYLLSKHPLFCNPISLKFILYQKIKRNLRHVQTFATSRLKRREGERQSATFVASGDREQQAASGENGFVKGRKREKSKSGGERRGGSEA